MAILPQQRPMSKQYGIVIFVVYLALAGWIIYRGYERHDAKLYIFAAILIAAAVARLIRVTRAGAAQQQTPKLEDKDKVDLFTKPKDF